MSDNKFRRVPLLRGFDKIAPIFYPWEKRAVFAGGYARWAASPLVEPPPAGDIDVFPNTDSDHEAIIADLAKWGLKKPTRQTSVASVFEPLGGRLAGVPPINVVTPRNQGAIVVEGGVENILSNFDFTIVRAAVVSPTEVLVDEDFLEDEANRRLVIKNIHCPISSTLRFMKYAKKGYRASAEEVLKLFRDWDARPVEYREALIRGLPRLRASGEDALEEDEKLALAKLIYID